jgi:hypothetical protein
MGKKELLINEIEEAPEPLLANLCAGKAKRFMINN